MDSDCTDGQKWTGPPVVIPQDALHLTHWYIRWPPTVPGCFTSIARIESHSDRLHFMWTRGASVDAGEERPGAVPAGSIGMAAS